MKKTLLSIILTFGLGILANAQCTPNPLYQDSTFGAWPDTTTNLAPAMEGVAYTQVLDFKLPTNAGDINPNFPGVPVDSAVLTNVTGLPTWMSYQCNVSSCTWYGGQQGCATLSGTPPLGSAGTYDITILIKGYATAFLVGPISQNVEFTGYKLVVSSATGITVVEKDGFELAQNSPNPFSEETNISFVTGVSGTMNFKVMDILGNVVHEQMVKTTSGDNVIRFKNNNLSDGIYMYTLSNGKHSVTKKMIIRK